MNKKRIILVLIAALLLMWTVKADFTPSIQESEKTVCQSSTEIFTLFVEGSGNININKEGAASSFSTISPPGFTLSGKKPIFVYMTPNSKTQPGSYVLNLKINDGSSEKIVPLNINVKDCNTFELVPESLNKEVCGCSSQSYDYSIKNTGIYQETYDISTKGEAKSIVELDKKEVKIDPGNSGKVTATINPPCNEQKTKQFAIEVKAKTSGATASVDSIITIKNCFDYNAIVNKNLIEMCEHTKQELPILVDNTADIDNSYVLSMTGPAWANLDKKEIFAKSGNKGQANLILTPDYGVNGNFKVNVKIESKEGGVKKEKTIEAKVKECHSASVDIVKPIETVCHSTTKKVPVLIQNTGEFDKVLELSTDVNWARTSKAKIDVGSSDDEEIELVLSPTNETATGKYPITINMVSLDDSKIAEQDVIEVTVMTEEECYRPSINTKDKIKVAKESTATSNIAIKNEGEEKADYEVTITGTASEFIHLNPSAIAVEPKTTEVMQLYIAPTIRANPGTYTAKISVKESGSSILDEKEIIVEVTDNSNQEPKSKEESKITGLAADKKDLIDFKKETTITNSIEFSLNGKEHKIEIQEISQDSITLKISSDPIFVVLNVSETKEIDINEDGVADLKLFLDSIKDGEPKIKVQEINTNEVAESNTGFFSKYKNWVIGIIIIIVLIILANIFFSEDEEEQEEPKEEDGEEGKIRIGRYVVLVVIIGIIYWLSKKYSLLSSLIIYKLYVILGIVILIILILVIKYWKNLLDFFEEEEEEKKEPEKKDEKTVEEPKKKTLKKK